MSRKFVDKVSDTTGVGVKINTGTGSGIGGDLINSGIGKDYRDKNEKEKEIDKSLNSIRNNNNKD